MIELYRDMSFSHRPPARLEPPLQGMCTHCVTEGSVAKGEELIQEEMIYFLTLFPQ